MAKDDIKGGANNKKGNPSDEGQDKASIKKGKSAEELEREEELRNQHLDRDSEIPSHLEKNPNRNEDKTNTSEPKYGSSK